MKIIQVVNSMECGGQERIVLHLSRALKARGHGVLIVCLSRIGEFGHEAMNSGIEVVSLGHAGGFCLKTCWRLLRLIKRFGPQVIHAHNLGPLVYSCFASRLAFSRIRVVLTRHGREPLKTHPFIWGLTDVIVAISADAKEQMAISNGIARDRIRVVYNGVPVEPLVSAASRKGGDKDIFIVGHVARLTGVKDQRNLLSAFQRVLKMDGVRARLVIAGDGEDRGALEDLSRDLGIAGQVDFLGFSQEVHSLMCSFNVFVLPSLTEGISLTILEAMAASRPVVTTNVGGNPEVVINGRTGILVPSQDPDALAQAIIKIIREPDLAFEMGKNGRKRFEEVFNLDLMVTCYEEAYRTL